MDNRRDVFAEPSGATGHVPLGKSQLAWTDFAAGVASTKAGRMRASGGSHANPSARSIVAYDDMRKALHTEVDDSTDLGGDPSDSDNHREGHGIDRR